MLPVFYILKNCKINKNLIRVLPFFTFHKLTPFVSLYSILSVFYLLITLIISPVFPTFYTNSYPSFFPTYANSNFCLPYFIFFFHHTVQSVFPTHFPYLFVRIPYLPIHALFCSSFPYHYLHSSFTQILLYQFTPLILLHFPSIIASSPRPLSY